MENITLGHGSGGRLTEELIKRITSNFSNDNSSGDLEDCSFIGNGMAITIDSFTVTPREFSGGNIGELSVCGSTNDLAVRGVKPEYLAMSVVIEEGMAMEEFDRYMASAATICADLDVKLSTGDTKVVPKGSVDGLFITTCAVGTSVTPFPWGMKNLRVGDLIAVTTSIGRHGATIGANRFNLESKTLQSDCAALWPAISDITMEEGIRCMRDCTRGGLGTVLCEWAEGTSLGIEVDEEKIPISPDVNSVCDILGFDPIYLACEGCAALAFSPDDTRIISKLKQHDICKDITVIGEVVESHKKFVGMRTSIGGIRVIDMPIAEMLPRIC